MGAGKIASPLIEPVFKAAARAGGEIVEEVAPEWVKPLTRTIFGTNPIPKGVGEVLNKTSKIQAETFTKGIEFDSGLREPLEQVYTLAGQGRSDAYELLTILGRDFKEEALNAKKLKQAQTQYANLQRQIDDARAGQTGDKMRKTSATIQNPEGPPTHRTGQALKPDDPEFERYVTEGHHAIILGEGQKIPLQHRSAELITPAQKSPIIEARERIMGIESGNAEANIADVLETMTKESRTARLLSIGEQTDGVIDSKTANDALGMTGYKPRMLDETGNVELDKLGLERVHFDRLRQQDPTLTTQRYMDTEKSPTTGRAYTEGSFPNIRVFLPGSKHTGKNKAKPFKTIEINNAKDHKNRWNLIFNALDEAGVDTRKARKNFNQKAQKIDRNLDIYGEDHQLTHRLIEGLKQKEGTAFYEIEQLGPEGVYNLPLEEAIKLDIRAVQEMETVLANVLQYRYGIVKELFYEINPHKGKNGFELLPADEKQFWFKKHVNTIAVRGNVSKAITLDNALKRPKTFDNHIADTFGWRPQSLFATIEEIEAIAKELAEKVPTTQPGVE